MDSTLPTSGVADELIERQKHAENQESQQQSPGQDGPFVEWIALDSRRARPAHKTAASV